MKVFRVTLAFVFAVIGIAEIVHGSCVVKNTESPKAFLYQCFNSNDYLEELNRAPVDIQKVTFTNSKIPVVKDGSFERLSKSLERLAVFHSGVREIEDNAFRGLSKLTLLAFPGNDLRVIKSAWFEGLVSLQEVTFQYNRIAHIDEKVFTILPPLRYLDISLNEVTCLPVASSFNNLKLNDLHFLYNRLTPLCEAELMKWLTERHVTHYSQFDVNWTDTQHDVAKTCIGKMPKSDEKTLSKCIEKTTHELLPAKANYTMKEMCEFAKEKPSPWLNCDK